MCDNYMHIVNVIVFVMHFWSPHKNNPISWLQLGPYKNSVLRQKTLPLQLLKLPYTSSVLICWLTRTWISMNKVYGLRKRQGWCFDFHCATSVSNILRRKLVNSCIDCGTDTHAPGTSPIMTAEHDTRPSTYESHVLLYWRIGFFSKKVAWSWSRNITRTQALCFRSLANQVSSLEEIASLFPDNAKRNDEISHKSDTYKHIIMYDVTMYNYIRHEMFQYHVGSFYRISHICPFYGCFRL